VVSPRPPAFISRFFRLPLFFYRLRLGWIFGKRFMVLTHVGRRSGKVYRSVLAVLAFDPATRELKAISPWSSSNWFNNIRAAPALEVETAGVRYAPRQRFLTAEEIAESFIELRRQRPIFSRMIARIPGWKINSTSEEFLELARTLRGVAFEPKNAQKTIQMKASSNQGRQSTSFGRKAGRVMLIVLSILLVLVLVAAGILLAMSPGTMLPLVDESGRRLAGSISEKVFVEINGVKQGMFIQSTDTSHPVMLYLHGGMPDYMLQQKYPTGLENLFTIVWWEQRGSGMSFSPDIPLDSLTNEHMISDTLEVTNYLRDRFGKEKIYLMGHSGGSFIGIQAAARAPDLYHAYIGVAQMSDQLKSEKLAYDYMLALFRANGNSSMVRKLEAAPVTLTGGTPDAYLALRDTAMHSLGIGTTHDMKSVVTGIVWPSFTSREYTLTEKVNMWRGKSRSGVAALWKTMTTTDLSRQLTEFEIPVYFLEGVYDYTCNYAVAKAYFEQISAPVSGFYSFGQSAHSPIFEEPAKVLRIFREDVLQATNALADQR
jgi:deazaflavin-dependent oxidoreductase (nitroreductase family)